MNVVRPVTVSGTVTDDNPAGLTVTLTGVVGTTATTDSSGRFSVTTNAAGLGVVNATTVDSNGLGSNTATANISCAAPLISNFTCVDNAGVVTLAGTVTDAAANGMAVTLQGNLPSLLNGHTVSADAGGHFTYSFTAAPGDQGTVTATCTDCWGQASNTATATLTPSPVVTLAVTMNGGRSVTLSGVVTANNPAGMTVSFTGTGVTSATAVTDSTGHYSLTLTAASLGDVHAATVDSLGQTSNTAIATIACPAPVISNLTYVRSAGYVTLTGTVTHPDAVGMVVTIEGTLLGLQSNPTAVVRPDGTFSLTIASATGEQGWAWACCMDCWSQASNEASKYVS
jgi:hypothetical protein